MLMEVIVFMAFWMQFVFIRNAIREFKYVYKQ